MRNLWVGKVGYQMGRFWVFMPRSSRFPGWPRRLFLAVGEGFTAPAGAFRRPTAAQRRLLGRRSLPRAFAAARGSRADIESAPTWVCNHARFAFSRLAATFIPVRRGGIYPSRGRLHRRGVPGTMQASSPTWVCDIAGFVVFPLAAPFVPVRRGGIYPSRRCLRRRGVRRDEGIPPYGRSVCTASTGNTARFRREKRHVGADSISARGGAAGSGACRGLQPPSAAVMPRFFIKALRFPGWRFWRAVRPAIRRWGFRRIFRSIRPQGSGAAFPAGSCACRRSW